MVTLTFNDEQIMVIDRALGQMPYTQVAALIADINEQIAAQQKPRGPTEVDLDRLPDRVGVS